MNRLKPAVTLLITIPMALGTMACKKGPQERGEEAVRLVRKMNQEIFKMNQESVAKFANTVRTTPLPRMVDVEYGLTTKEITAYREQQDLALDKIIEGTSLDSRVSTLRRYCAQIAQENADMASKVEVFLKGNTDKDGGNSPEEIRSVASFLPIRIEQLKQWHVIAERTAAKIDNLIEK